MNLVFSCMRINWKQKSTRVSWAVPAFEGQMNLWDAWVATGRFKRRMPAAFLASEKGKLAFRSPLNEPVFGQPLAMYDWDESVLDDIANGLVHPALCDPSTPLWVSPYFMAQYVAWARATAVHWKLEADETPPIEIEGRIVFGYQGKYLLNTFTPTDWMFKRYGYLNERVYSAKPKLTPAKVSVPSAISPRPEDLRSSNRYKILYEQLKDELPKNTPLKTIHNRAVEELSEMLAKEIRASAPNVNTDKREPYPSVWFQSKSFRHAIREHYGVPASSETVKKALALEMMAIEEFRPKPFLGPEWLVRAYASWAAGRTDAKVSFTN